MSQKTPRLTPEATPPAAGAGRPAAARHHLMQARAAVDALAALAGAAVDGTAGAVPGPPAIAGALRAGAVLAEAAHGAGAGRFSVRANEYAELHVQLFGADADQLADLPAVAGRLAGVRDLEVHTGARNAHVWVRGGYPGTRRVLVAAVLDAEPTGADLAGLRELLGLAADGTTAGGA